MRVLIVGNGAREHAIARTLAREPAVTDILCAPGNPGMTSLGRLAPVNVADPGVLVSLARQEQVDLTVVGPELPLANGVADAFTAAGLLLVGPSRAAAELESSKAFAKAFMARHRVPTARYRLAGSPERAMAVLASGAFSYPVVLKADGLAGGKGVIIAADETTARAAIQAMMVERQFGAAGATVVVEEFLVGQEASFFVVTDGQRAATLPSAQDHKRVFDGDQGPNTGGMGAFAPSPLVTPTMTSRIMSEIVHPVLEGMRAEGREYRGFLYVGLMITADGPKVVEFNVRLGDPETQVVLPLVDAGFLPLLEGAARGRLDTSTVSVSDDRAVGVVLASAGYPGRFEAGHPITGVADAEAILGVTIFHAGTALRDGVLVTAGGRVLTAVGRGASYGEAIDRAYDGAVRVRFEGRHMRRDIGVKALEAR